MRRTGLSALVLLIPLASLPAAADELSVLLAAHRHTMTWNGDALTGPGADFLRAAAAEAEMLLIGESHGNRETPGLTAALLPDLAEAGYGALAVETGPITAELLSDLATDPAGAAAFQRYLEQEPLAFPFFWWREEAEMLRGAVAHGFAVWGLDQEFITSARFLLARLAGRLDGAERERALAWLAEAEASFARFTETGDQAAGFLNEVDPAELRAFAAKLEDRRGRAILEELAASAVVYQHFRAGRYFENNRDRIVLMKRHLLAALEAAGGLKAAPKVLFKLGSVHMGRGYSPFHQLDLGNQAAELSFARGGDSFHLLVLARHAAAPDGSRRDLAGEAPYLPLLDPHLPAAGWMVFDLRPLRAHLSIRSVREKHPELAALVFRFDALAVAPLFHPAEALVPLPFG